ncbi:hypothetical protein Dimus_029755, partial [Dionaea muscipula]
RIIEEEKGTHSLAYGFILTKVFKHFGIRLGEGTSPKENDMIDLQRYKDDEGAAGTALGTGQTARLIRLVGR